MNEVGTENHFNEVDVSTERWFHLRNWHETIGRRLSDMVRNSPDFRSERKKLVEYHYQAWCKCSLLYNVQKHGSWFFLEMNWIDNKMYKRPVYASQRRIMDALYYSDKAQDGSEELIKKDSVFNDFYYSIDEQKDKKPYIDGFEDQMEKLEGSDKDKVVVNISDRKDRFQEYDPDNLKKGQKPLEQELLEWSEMEKNDI